MPLFHPRLTKQMIENPEPIPDSHLQILNDWHKSIESEAIYQEKETSLHNHFTQQILINILGYQGYQTDAAYNLKMECPIGRGSVDVALGTFEGDKIDVLAPFELKGAKTKDLDSIPPGRIKTPVQQAWEYAMDAVGAKWVLVSNYVELRLYAIGHTRYKYESWQLAELTEPAEYTRFMRLLAADNLLSGQTWDLLQQSEQIEKDITDKLYFDYKRLRLELIADLQAENDNLTKLDTINYAQTILDRILFVAFAEDRGLLPDKILKRAYETQSLFIKKPIWDNFKGLFQAIDVGSDKLNVPAYNGSLFKPYKLLDDLKLSDTICLRFKELGDYDFNTEVNVTVLGHIFEQSITDLEELRAEVQDDKLTLMIGKRKREGVVYTPDSITHFIVEQTLGSYIQEYFEQLREQTKADRNGTENWKNQAKEIAFWRKYQNWLKTVKVVDPACGSGAFLVAAFDFLYQQYEQVNQKLAELTGQSDFFDLDKEILNSNLYGVDVNHESIEITKLSLWLKTAKKGKKLLSLENNFKIGDSLIEDSNIAYRAFLWKKAFPKVFKQNGFDVVLGNPPYVRQELISSFKPYLQNQYEVYHGVADLYSYFFERGLRLLKDNGMLGFICSSTFFKTSSGKNLRRYLLNHVRLHSVLDFGDLQVFKGVTTYPAILTMQKQCPPLDYQFPFLKLKQLPKQELNKEFEQKCALMPQLQLTEKTWHLEDSRLAILRAKIMQNKPTLKEVYGSLYRGIVTGLNEAFVIDRTTRDKLIEQDAKSADIIKPFLEGRDLKKWRVEGRDLYLIFTKQGIDIEQYPAIKAYLKQFKSRLMPKSKNWKGEQWHGRATGNYQWYEIQSTIAYYQAFEKFKIIYAHFSSKPLFSMDTQNFYANDKSYIIPHADYFLLGLLNSDCYWFIIKALCPFVRGQFYELRVQYIETLPIPNATDEQKAKIGELAKQCQQFAEQRYKKQQAVRWRIPDLCPDEQIAKLNTKLNNWWQLDDFQAFQAEIKKLFKTEIPLKQRNEWEEWLNEEKTAILDLTQQIEQLEHDVNQQVYKLFELTAEEIKLVEDNI